MTLFELIFYTNTSAVMIESKHDGKYLGLTSDPSNSKYDMCQVHKIKALENNVCIVIDDEEQFKKRTSGCLK